MRAESLIAFQNDIAAEFERGKIHAPIHLCDPSQAEPLIDIFKKIGPNDWVFCTWRSIFHALLKGIPPKEVKRQIMEGHCMSLMSLEHRFFTSAIMGGCLPIACGVAAKETAWVFIGDMCASIGAFEDACHYAKRNSLKINFVVEDNGLSTNTPTARTWGTDNSKVRIKRYLYRRKVPHTGVGKFVQF